jgi:NAD(P)-dependent dehydrogenase (short-subunit alcohol dehydrogenase family)
MGSIREAKSGSDLQGQVAFITGGTRGIGRAIAESLLHAGANVAITGRDERKADDLKQKWKLSNRLLIIEADMSTRIGVEESIDQTEAKFGLLNIAILNAGGVNNSTPIAVMSDEEWEFELNLNLNHTFWGMRRALQSMLPQKSGRIIAVSSIEGKHGKANVAGYTANKHGINGLVKAAAREVGKEGIGVMAICPGIVHTDMLERGGGKALGLNSVAEVLELFTANTALKRAVTVDEIADFVLFLCGSTGLAFAGGTLSIDGGDAYY